MKKVIKITFVAAFAAIAGYSVYMNQAENTHYNWFSTDVEAIAGCEVSSNSSNNRGSCIREYNGSGDACVENSSSGAVRCSGNN